MSSELLFRGPSERLVPLTLKRSPRARVMRLRVDSRTGAVVLTLPRRASERKALQWVAGHREWIESALAKLPEVPALGDGSEISFRGEPHRIEWREKGSRIVKREPGLLVVGGSADGLEARLIRWLKAQARDILSEDTAEFAAKAGVTVARVGIGDPVSRWGSCSSSGTIRYSWRLILAPDWVRRATVAHEVAHRIHMNHGPAFHALNRELLGSDPAVARQWLRQNGASLHRIGRSAQ